MLGRWQSEFVRELREIREGLRADREVTREIRDGLREDREAHRQFTAEMTLQLRQMRLEGEARLAELRAHRDEWREAHDEMIAEQRAGRQALLAVLDRLPPPGEATA